MKSKMILTLTAVFCCLVMAGGTAYAYFAYSVQTNLITVQIADYGISITAETPAAAVYMAEGESTDTENTETESAVMVENGHYTFAEDGTIVFKLTAAGTATAGYCEVSIQNGVSEQEASGEEEPTEQMYCTEQILPGNTYAFSVTATAGTTVRFDANWGTRTIVEGESIQTIGDAGVIVLAEVAAEEEEPAADSTPEPEEEDKPTDTTSEPEEEDKPADTTPEPEEEDKPADTTPEPEEEDKPADTTPEPEEENPADSN